MPDDEVWTDPLHRLNGEEEPRPFVSTYDAPVDPDWDVAFARMGGPDRHADIKRLQEMGFGFVPLPTNKKSPPGGVIKGKVTWPQAIATTNILKTLDNPGTQNAAMTPPTGVVGLDADDGWPELRAAKEAELGPLPPTLTVITPNGEHLFYRWPKSQPEPQHDWWGQVVARWDFRTTTHDGGYTVAPGSYWDGLDRDGLPEPGKKAGSYTVYRTADGDDFAIAELPEEWARDVLAAPNGAPAVLTAAPNGAPLAEVRPHYELPEPGYSGSRYKAVLAYTAHLYNRGFSEAEMWSLVQSELVPRFAEPLTTPKVRERFDRAVEDIAVNLGPPKSVPPPPVGDVSVGSRTAADLSFAAPPLPLVDGVFLAAEGWTVLYANGGTGKGFVSAWLICELVRGGEVVMVIDYEGHESEWGFRLRGLGLTELELLRVHYREPFGSDWTAPKDDLAKVWQYLRADAVGLGVTYFVVDSYTMAADPGAELGGAEAAKAFFGAAGRLGRGLVIAHTSGDMRFPPKPFGSRFVHNIPRETWALERVERPSAVGSGSGSGLVSSAVIELEARNMKRAAGEKSRPQFLTFEVFPDGRIDVRRGAPVNVSIAELADGILSAEGPMDTRGLAAAIKEDTGQAVDPDSIRRVLERWPERYVKDTSKRPHVWAVAEVEED